MIKHNDLISDAEIYAQISGGHKEGATVRIQARQMKALERIADALEAQVAAPVMPLGLPGTLTKVG